MSFSEKIKLEAKKRANFRCCFCEEKEILEIHHLIPENQNGPDTFDNAIPLCPSCHTKYGNNPDLRKYLKQKRDWWYDKCSQLPIKKQINEEIELQIRRYLKEHIKPLFKKEGTK